MSPGMRDIFEDIFQNEPIDPTESARRSLRPKLRRRFYAEAAAGELDGTSPLLLDGKPARTPAGRPLAAPVRALTEAIAAEWSAQRDTIDPATMPLTRLANSIIDGVAVTPAPVAAEVAQYLGSDLLFYRAGTPAGLVERQAQHWDPILDWARETFGARFILSEGIVHVAQPEGSLAAVRAAIPDDPWRLGAVHVVTTLTGSALLALALAHGRLSAEDAWAAAHADEDWNMDFWGRDELALERRAFRWAEMQAAAKVLRFHGA
jgi:chaperone required for assembly of F1-ATPase